MPSFYVKFSDFKQQNLKVAKAFQDCGYLDRSQSIENCATQLLFGNRFDGGHDLIFGNFCKDRFCPLCQARRSSKRAVELMHAVENMGGQFLFLTLTVVNVKKYFLRSTIKKMTSVFADFIKDPRIKKGVRGYLRNLEVTYNAASDTFHPHFHVLIHVDDDYFSSDKYLKRSDVLNVWRAYMHDDRINQVDIRKVRGDRLDKAIVEVTKYFTKFNDWIFSKHCSSILDTFVDSLRNVNCTTMGGTIRKEILRIRAEKDADYTKFDEKIAIFIQNANYEYDTIETFSFSSPAFSFKCSYTSDSVYTWSNVGSDNIYYIVQFFRQKPFFNYKFSKALDIVEKFLYQYFLMRCNAIGV